LPRGLGGNTTARQALGYKEVMAHLRGETSLADTIALVKTRTRQFAKRQLTWFRHQARVEWVRVAADGSAATIAERLLHSPVRGDMPIDRHATSRLAPSGAA
ncbi:MAG: tRNA (adenosine(37)-N6)-dimethylallyltransferase MiaA, partial [Verrucomicrobia bacterium]|nr:tRNA (adenosine(37)-N6)-dimethylallyltransferase MiaA [Verrucomicrobiota bacterium]